MLLGLTLAAAGCADPALTMSVDQVVADWPKLVGKEVRVVGFLPSCGGYDCSLFESVEDFELAMTLLNKPPRHVRPADIPQFIGIAHDEQFDARASKFAGRYVAVTATIGPSRGGGTDRNPDIVASKIEAWTPRSANSRGNL